MAGAGSGGNRHSQAAVALPPADDELIVLIGRLCDGVLSRADCTRLETLMRSSPQAIAIYCAALELNAALQWRWYKARQTSHETTASQTARQRRDAAPASALGAPAGVASAVPQTMATPRAAPAATTTKRSTPREPSPWAAWLGRIGAALDRPLPRIMLVFGALLTALVVGAAIEFVGSGSLGGWTFQSRREPGSVACVTRLHDAAWAAPQGAGDAAAPRRHASLFPGQRFDLVRGLVEIAFDGGATTIIEGPATFEVVSLAAGRLSSGRLTATLDKSVAQAASAEARFAVETPTATVTDLGTSFGVAVGAAGETSVSVFDGLVELLPRLAGDTVPAGLSQPLRLAAGESAGVATDRTAKRGLGGKRIAFTRAIPEEAAQAPTVSLPVAWDESKAVAVFYDPFAGAGDLAESTPAARGGVGEAAWLAPADWQLDAAAGGLAAASAGAALLPFTPEPGHRYRLSVTIEIVDGGFGWASLGFAASDDTRKPTISVAWNPEGDGPPPKPEAQQPQTAAGPTSAERLRGIQTRTLILDTSGPQWRLFSLAGETFVGEQVFATLPADISHVAVSVFPNTAAVVRGFSLQKVRINR
jgi:hypothetical protein